jgi:hypothetical protein
MFRQIGIIGIIALFLFTACSPERKLANEYVNKYKGNGVMIIPDFVLYKDNRTIGYDTAVSYSPAQFDSIAWAQSYFIKDVSDSIFLTKFTNSMIDELSAIGFDVYVDGSSDVFLSLPDPKWMVQIAQLQLDEDHNLIFHQKYSIETGEPYSVGARINQVLLSSWLEVSRANTGNKQVLYLEAYIEDDFRMGIDFDPSEGSVGLNADRDSIVLSNVYEMAEDLGKKHADLLFDYFMNDYIRENLPSGIVKREYFHYDLQKKVLKRGLKERFDVVN